MKQWIYKPLFWVGLTLRLGLILLVVSQPLSDWYGPFLSSSLQNFSIDPWQTWLDGGGDVRAFPYGYATWLAFLPLAIVGSAISLPVGWSYGLTLLFSDLVLLELLRRLTNAPHRLLLIGYWLSPIVILGSYFWGFNDLLAITLLTGALYATRQRLWHFAGALLVAAISAKISMILAVPYFAIYLIRNKAIRQYFREFATGALGAAILLILPFLVSEAGRQMTLSSPDMVKVFQFQLPIGADAGAYVVPLVYFLMLYSAWRVRRVNFELFQAVLGVSFLMVVLLTPLSPGWFIWAIPLLATYQASGDRVAFGLCLLFSIAYAMSVLVSFPMPAIADNHYTLPVWWARVIPGGASAQVLFQTMIVTLGILLAMRVWRDTVNRNDFFRLSRRPFVIGIAGDSGAGKDTFAESIEGLFGQHSVAKISGDDYHLWDRHKPMWQVMTHLNPVANDLERFAADLIALTDGRAVTTRHYDHTVGRMSRPFKQLSNDFIIASGLHALYLPLLRSSYNLSVYLDIDEGLRRYFKMERDVKERGHSVEKVSAAFERRESDSARFIRPQAEHADLIFSLQPVDTEFAKRVKGKEEIRLKLQVRSRQGLNEASVRRALVGFCGMRLDIISVDDSVGEIVLVVEGDVRGDDLAVAAGMICPATLEFLDVGPYWKDGLLGVMQLLTLCHINQALTKRFIR